MVSIVTSILIFCPISEIPFLGKHCDSSQGRASPLNALEGSAPLLPSQLLILGVLERELADWRQRGQAWGSRGASCRCEDSAQGCPRNINKSWNFRLQKLSASYL